MYKIVTLLAFISGGILLVGCNSQSNQSANKEAESLVSGTYSGVIPCADCPGILYEISFNDNQKYNSSSIYIGRSNRPFSENGTWKIENDTLVVLQGASGDGTRHLAFNDSTLVMLGQDGKQITGSLADHYVLDRKEASTEDEAMKWTDLRDQGIDFRAAGNEPSWGLTIDFDKNISFKTMNGDSIQTPVPEMERDTASQARTLAAETESGALSVALHPTGCMDDMSGEVFTHGVVIDYNGTTYRGCGNVINDRYRLHDFWTLHSLEGSEISQSDSLRKVPALQFDLKNGKVFGNNGCNQLNGGVEVEGESLTFGQMVSTKMACQGNMESRFMDALQQVNRYTVRQGELMLLSENDTLMTFHRAE